MDLELPHSPIVDQPQRPKRSRRRVVIISLAALLILGVILVASLFIAYRQALEPLMTSQTTVLFEVESGQSTETIAQSLEQQALIQNAAAFQVYARLQNDTLQVGVYELNSTMSTPEIFDIIAGGETATRAITIIPGFTLLKIQDRLIAAGYDETAVREALEASYDLSVTKYIPPSRSLEGFLYPDTYLAGLLQSPEEIIELALSEMDEALTDDRIAGFKRQGLSVFEAVTLASIVQREIDDPELQKQIAQVYLKRLNDGIRLDADPTFRYASELAGVEDQLDINSPYNTRQVKGLPPGPIGAVTTDALDAVINPADGDFLFFVTGDDGTTYFSTTLEEHESKVDQYCNENCRINFN